MSLTLTLSVAAWVLQSPDDTNHKVRVAFGNGLRRDVWQEFKARFQVPIIGEFYAATEGNAGFINHFNKTGCVGRASPLLVRDPSGGTVWNTPEKPSFIYMFLMEPVAQGLC